jgi:hypothetical protein
MNLNNKRINKRITGAALAVLLTAGLAAAQQNEKAAQQNENVERGQLTGRDGLVHPFTVARLAPAAFPGLPGAVREELARRECLVPQTSAAKQPENVISGKYRDGSTTDWAVLCSREGYSSVLVFWSGAAQSVEEFARQKDTDSMQVSRSNDFYEYSRRITTAPPERVRKRKENRKLGPFEHDGIDDAFVGKGSTIYYFRQGRWQELQGGE